MLLVLSLCLYSGAMLVTCLIFLVRTTHLPFSTDKAVAYPPWGQRRELWGERVGVRGGITPEGGREHGNHALSHSRLMVCVGGRENPQELNGGGQGQGDGRG